MAAAGQSVTLEPGASYRATLALTGIETWASNDQVLDKIQSAVGPWRDANVQGSGGTRFAQGRYAGARRTVALPSQVASFLRVDAPAAPPVQPRALDLDVDVVAGRPSRPVFTDPGTAPAPVATTASAAGRFGRVLVLVALVAGGALVLWSLRKGFA